MLKNKKMFDKVKGTISQFLPTIIAGLILFGIGIVLAGNWHSPTDNPPEGNVPQPLNVGGEWQAKDAPIGFNSVGSGVKGFVNSTRWIGNINGDFVIGAGTKAGGESAQLSIDPNGLIELKGKDGSRRITNVEDPIKDSDVATKEWVLAQIGGGGGGGFVTVAESDDEKFTKEDYDKVKNFMYEKGGVIVGVVCKRSDEVDTFYSGHAFISIPLGGYFVYTLGSGNYSFLCTGGCS